MASPTQPRVPSEPTRRRQRSNPLTFFTVGPPAVTKRPSKLVELLGHIISFNFDIHNNMLTAMPTKVWKEAYDVFSRILKTLVDNPDLVIEHVESSSVVDTKQMTTAEAGDEEDEEATVAGRNIESLEEY